MLNRRFMIGASLVGSLLLSASAFAQSPSQPIVGIATTATYSVDARITAVDAAARTVTLANTNGTTTVRKVSPSVANFAQARVGDMVSLGMEDKLTFVLSRPNAQVPSARDVSATVVAGGSGGGLAGATAQQSIGNWWVTGVDTQANTISVVAPGGGEVRTYNVTTAEGRAQLPRVKAGDYLTAIDSQIAVISITPK
jgi:hypothetical protein